MAEELKDWQKRVIDEEAELGQRIEKLEKFLDSNPSKLDCPVDLLKDQLLTMKKYDRILMTRIKMFQ